jgi:hypothetical protein
VKQPWKLLERDIRAAVAVSEVRLVNAFSVFVQLISPPAILLAGVLGLWRLGADLSWTGEFPISSGVFSRYQVWFAVGFALYLSACAIDRRTANRISEL